MIAIHLSSLEGLVIGYILRRNDMRCIMSSLGKWNIEVVINGLISSGEEECVICGIDVLPHTLRPKQTTIIGGTGSSTVSLKPNQSLVTGVVDWFKENHDILVDDCCLELCKIMDTDYGTTPASKEYMVMARAHANMMYLSNGDWFSKSNNFINLLSEESINDVLTPESIWFKLDAGYKCSIFESMSSVIKNGETIIGKNGSFLIFREQGVFLPMFEFRNYAKLKGGIRGVIYITGVGVVSVWFMCIDDDIDTSLVVDEYNSTSTQYGFRIEIPETGVDNLIKLMYNIL